MSEPQDARNTYPCKLSDALYIVTFVNIEKEIRKVLSFGFFLHNYFHYYTNSRIYSIAYNYFLEI